jgi:hypothetical protein
MAKRSISDLIMELFDFPIKVNEAIFKRDGYNLLWIP